VPTETGCLSTYEPGNVPSSSMGGLLCSKHS
jgi:hypothetical protein